MLKRSRIIFILLAASLILLQATSYCEKKPSAPEPARDHPIVTSKTIDMRITGLRVYKPGKCYEGYVLFNNFPDRSPEDWFGFTAIYLLDTKGEMAYRWMASRPVAFSRLDKNGHLFYAAVVPYDKPETGLRGLYELDLNNNEVWGYPAAVHHDFNILEDGLFIVLANIRYELSSENLLRTYNYPFMIGPHIDIISRDMKVLWSWQGEKHIPEIEKLIGKKIPPFEQAVSFSGDWFHHNTCVILDDNPLAKIDPRFRKGNIIFCSFNLDLVGIIEYPSGKIVWTFGPGVLDGPHSPTMLDNGNFLILDNGVHRGWSRVIEIDPLKNKVVWEYRADPPDSFFSSIMSNATRLPNGNTFICDGAQNRLFEITPDGEIVWDMIPTFDPISGYFGILRAEKYSREYVKPLLRNKRQ